MSKVNKEQIAATLRQTELARRAARRQIILNEVALVEDEELDEAGAAADKAAIERLRQADAERRKYELPPVGYWRRLWLAICGRSV